MNIISYIKNKLTGIKLAVMEDGTAKIDSVNGFKIAETSDAHIINSEIELDELTSEEVEEIANAVENGKIIIFKYKIAVDVNVFHTAYKILNNAYVKTENNINTEIMFKEARGDVKYSKNDQGVWEIFE